MTTLFLSRMTAALLVGLSGPVGLAHAQQRPAPAQQSPAKQAPAQGGQTDRLGNIVSPGVQMPPPPPPPPVHACLQLYSPTGAVFNFDLTVNPTSSPPFAVTAAVITGNLCSPASWTLNPGATMGPTLNLAFQRPAGSPCGVTQFAVQGNAVAPAAYTGTYKFPGTTFGNFPQNTLFLGWNKPTCP